MSMMSDIRNREYPPPRYPLDLKVNEWQSASTVQQDRLTATHQNYLDRRRPRITGVYTIRRGPGMPREQVSERRREHWPEPAPRPRGRR